MKFTLSWLKEHLETEATVDQVVEAMTMAGLEVEHVENPAAKLAAFSVAKIVEAVQHPNADRLRVCQVDTKDGRKEIVCGAPNARPGLTTIYAPLGAYVPGAGITLEARPVRGVVSNGMLCSASELEVAEESDGIMELPDSLSVGASAAQALGLEAVIDFEVTPNRPDWLGVAGIARDLAAAGLGQLKDLSIAPVKGAFPCPVQIRLDAPEACPVFAGRLFRGVKNGPSPAWLQQRLVSIGLRPINALVDIPNLITYDRARPLHVYDRTKLVGDGIVARLGLGQDEARPAHTDAATPAEHHDEQLIALDGKTYDLVDFRGEQAVVIAWYPRAFTRGCTIECKSLAENGHLIREYEVTYFMASVDPLEENTAFAAEQNADFPLLSDPTKVTANAYGVLNQRGMANRWTFYIGKSGRILYIDKEVRPRTSAEDMAARLGELGVDSAQ